MDTSSIIWSKHVYTLKAFKSTTFPLPQVVKVEDGHYGNDQTTLSNGDVLTLHLVRKIRSYKAVTRKGDELYIPVSIEAKAEVTPTDEPRFYNSVEELVKYGVKQVEWVHNTPWLNVQEGDVLQVHDIVNNNDEEYLRMSLVSKTQSDILVPMNYRSTFKSHVKRQLWLTEIAQQFSFPITITFIDESLQLHTEMSNQPSTIADLGEVTLLGVLENEVFIASIQDEELIRVLKIPLHMDITVHAGIGIEKDDYTYADVCTEFNRRARLGQLNDTTLDSIRIGESEATVERIYEFPTTNSGDDSDYEDCHDYEEASPGIPSRVGRPPLRPLPQPSSEDENDREKRYDPNKPLPKSPKDNEGENKKKQFGSIFKKFRMSKSKRTHTYAVPISEHDKEAQMKSNREKTSCTVPNRYVGDRLGGSTSPITESRHLGTTSISEIPQNLECLSCDEVCNCLKMLRMEKHIETFHEQQIDGSLLVELTADEFTSLGVVDAFEQKKLEKFIGGWRPLTH